MFTTTERFLSWSDGELVHPEEIVTQRGFLNPSSGLPSPLKATPPTLGGRVTQTSHRVKPMRSLGVKEWHCVINCLAGLPNFRYIFSIGKVHKIIYMLQLAPTQPSACRPGLDCRAQAWAPYYAIYIFYVYAVYAIYVIYAIYAVQCACIMQIICCSCAPLYTTHVVRFETFCHRFCDIF